MFGKYLATYWSWGLKQSATQRLHISSRLVIQKEWISCQNSLPDFCTSQLQWQSYLCVINVSFKSCFNCRFSLLVGLSLVVMDNHKHRVIRETFHNSFTTFVSITPCRLGLGRDLLPHMSIKACVWMEIIVILNYFFWDDPLSPLKVSFYS
jgi:hypothetical protein